MAKVEKRRNKFDYEALKREFMIGDWLSLADFCRTKGLPNLADGTYANNTRGWVSEQKAFKKQITEKALQNALREQTRDVTTYLLQESRTFNELLTATRAVLAKSVKSVGDKQVVTLTPANVEALVRANDLIAKRLRVNIGLHTDKTESNVSVNSLQDVIAKAYEQLGTGETADGGDAAPTVEGAPEGVL